MSRPDHCTEEFEQIERQLHVLGWHKARIKFLARFLAAVISVGTVSLSRIASVFPTAAKAESSYKRIQRFLKDFDLDCAALARLVVTIVGAPGPWVLSLDRTNWKLGRTNINLLVLGLVHGGVAFPLFWISLGKAGNSSTAERIEIMERFLACFGRENIAYLCADREFVGRDWLRYLRGKGIGFRLRIKGDTHITNRRGAPVTARGLFWHGRTHEERHLGVRRVWGQPVYVRGMRLPEGDFLIVISEQEAELSDYALRWGIETLFGCLKSRGFDLEATHVTEADRLERLLALVALAFVWAFSAGLWRAEQRPIKIKKHGRAAVSVFRLGYDFLRRLLMPLCGITNRADFQKAVQLLSCT